MTFNKHLSQKLSELVSLTLNLTNLLTFFIISVVPVVWRDGTARTTVTPLVLSNVIALLVHLSGAPGLLLCQRD